MSRTRYSYSLRTLLFAIAVVAVVITVGAWAERAINSIYRDKYHDELVQQIREGRQSLEVYRDIYGVGGEYSKLKSELSQ